MFDSKEKKTGNDAAVTTTYNIDTEAQANAAMGKVESVPQVDAVFGAVGEDSVNYVNVGWIRASILCCKSQLGLGVLGIPGTLHTLGMVPGILIIAFLGGATTWSAYVVGRFKLNHPEVHSIADVGGLMAGPFGREVLGLIYFLYMVCSSAGGLLSIAISLNTLSEHGSCTVLFVAVAAIGVFLLSSIQTLGRVSWIGWVGMVSIVSAVVTLTIAVGVADRPATAPQVGPFDKGLVMFGSPTFAEASAALGTIVFAYGGTPAFFNVVAEMRNKKDFPKTVFVCQGFVTAVYLIIGAVVYYYCGAYVASPALGSAGLVMKKICYGLALPSLIAGSVVYTHLPAKYVFVRSLRGSPHLTRNSITHWAVWLGCVAFCVIVAFIIAEAIPVFDNLLSLVGALLGTSMTVIVMSPMWFWDNASRRHTNKTLRYQALFGYNIFVLFFGFFLAAAGTYGSIVALINSSGNGSFSCADNSV